MPIIIREIIPIIYNLFLLLSGTSFSLKDYHEIYINKVIHIQLNYLKQCNLNIMVSK